MPNLSVKLDEAMRQRLHEIAMQEGVTPHALMLRAIGHELDRAEAEGAFVRRALQARQGVEASGMAIDGPAFAGYLRARVRGASAQRPTPQDIANPTESRESDA